MWACDDEWPVALENNNIIHLLRARSMTAFGSNCQEWRLGNYKRGRVEFVERVKDNAERGWHNEGATDWITNV